MIPQSRPSLHIVFSPSAAGIVAQALRATCLEERVMSTAEDLSCGPIDDIRGTARRAWIAAHLDWTYVQLFDAAASHWDAATSPSTHPIAWVTRHDARDFSSYLAFVSRIGDAPFDLVDVSCLRLPRGHGNGTFASRHLALLSPDDIVAARLWDYRRTPAADEIARDRETWRRLQAENAPLRVMRDGALVSAPLSWFDEVVLGCAASSWQPGARVVGEAMAALYDRDELVGDAFLWGAACARWRGRARCSLRATHRTCAGRACVAFDGRPSPSPGPHLSD